MADSKTKRRAKADRPVLDGNDLTAEGPAGGQMDRNTVVVGDDEPSAVIEPAPGELADTIQSLGESVARHEPTGGYDLSEEAHRSAIERAEDAATGWELDPRALIANVRDCLLDQIKRRPKPWSALSPAEQRDVAAAAEHAAQELVRKTVEAVAARGQTPVRVLLDKVSLGDKIQITGTLKPLGQDEEDEAVMILHHARGHNVLLTVASKDLFAEHHPEAETDVEEPGLDFEAGAEEIGDPDLEAADLESGAAKSPDAHPLATGDTVEVEDYGACEVRINLKTGMVEAKAPLRDEYDIDVRQATPAELAQERERTAMFEESGAGGEDEQASAQT